MKPYYISIANSPFGPIHIIWSAHSHRLRVSRILLPNEDGLLSVYTRQHASVEDDQSHFMIREYTDRMKRFLEGEHVDFDLHTLALDQCSEFQRNVLLTEYGIPRGWISTYGRIARHIGRPQGARAVGHALATNPFPIVIPCHRAIRSNGELGGYRGGIEMKKKLLAMEGIRFTSSGKVSRDHIYY